MSTVFGYKSLIQELMNFVSVLYLATTTLGSQQCNLYRFGTKGAYQCALDWWQLQDLGVVVDTFYKPSLLVREMLKDMGIDYENATRSLIGQIMAESNDPIGKIIESGLTVEPHITFALADLLVAYGITAEELQRFSLPTELADRDNLIKMFTYYFNFSCDR